MSYLEELEALRRERCGVLDVAARGATDYSHGALKIQVAQHHLDEALPNGQKERTTVAFRLLVEGTAELRAWLVERGVEVGSGDLNQIK